MFAVKQTETTRGLIVYTRCLPVLLVSHTCNASISVYVRSVNIVKSFCIQSYQQIVFKSVTEVSTQDSQTCSKGNNNVFEPHKLEGHWSQDTPQMLNSHTLYNVIVT